MGGNIIQTEWLKKRPTKSSFCLSLFSVTMISVQIDATEILQKTQKNYFYHGQDYGSESQFNGLNPFFNVGLLLASVATMAKAFQILPTKKVF